MLAMSTTKRKKSDNPLLGNLKKLDFLKHVLPSKASLSNGKTSFLKGLKAEAEALSQLNIEKVDNILKLIYKLFLYSLLGFLAKFIIKLLKF